METEDRRPDVGFVLRFRRCPREGCGRLWAYVKVLGLGATAVVISGGFENRRATFRASSRASCSPLTSRARPRRTNRRPRTSIASFNSPSATHRGALTRSSLPTNRTLMFFTRLRVTQSWRVTPSTVNVR